MLLTSTNTSEVRRMASRLDRAKEKQKVELITSVPLVAEFGRVLTEKFGRDRRAVSEAVALVASMGTVVKPTDPVRQIEEDPDDDRVLEAALAGRADVIVSGDKDLLRLKSWRGIRILSPSDLLAEFV